jgi:hypothetical protein
MLYIAFPDVNTQASLQPKTRSKMADDKVDYGDSSSWQSQPCRSIYMLEGNRLASPDGGWIRLSHEELESQGLAILRVKRIKADGCWFDEIELTRA